MTTYLPTPFKEGEVTRGTEKAWLFEYKDRFGKVRKEWIPKSQSRVEVNAEGERVWFVRQFIHYQLVQFWKEKELVQ